MANFSARSLSLAIFFSLPVGAASALVCTFPEALVTLYVEDTPPIEDVLRHRSIVLSEQFLARDEGDVAVYGQLFRNTEAPFFHEGQLAGIRSVFAERSDDVQAPLHIEYTYMGAYRFEGHQILNGELVPFVDESIDARFVVSDNYGGLVGALPPTETLVLGVLPSRFGGQSLEVTTSACPVYLPVEGAQVADLLQCIRDGECK